MLIFQLYGEPPLAILIVTIFGKFSGLRRPSQLCDNFRTIGQRVFVGWVPENGMFPKESEVVLNTVLSANALHVICQKTTDRKSLSGFRMKTFSPLGVASLLFSIEKCYLKTANINVKKLTSSNLVLRTIKSYVKNCKYQFS
jgi:hypothetical protein